MAISANLNSFKNSKGEGRLGSQPGAAMTLSSPKSFETTRVSPQPTQPLTGVTAGNPVTTAFIPELLTQPAKEALSSTQPLATAVATKLPAATFVKPEILLPFLPPLLLPKTTTQLARGAIEHLNTANPATVMEAINTIINKNIAAGGLMNYLERKVKVGEVLNELAKDWADTTKQDFAEAFNMDRNKLEVMDPIVSIAILNDPELEEELRVENTPQTTDKDLLENRRIVWQYPPPGTPLEPPYLILVAVEHQDVVKAEEVLQSILGELMNYQGYKIPKTTVQRLRG
jgi:hypothetical protein